jgi:GH43 family beta-xylosidase
METFTVFLYAAFIAFSPLNDHARDHKSTFTNPLPSEFEAWPGLRVSRSPRAQPFTWNADGTPDFATPVPAHEEIPRPSGE